MQQTDQQRAAIETRAPQICVDAGAGSGKTRVLVERIVRLLDQGETQLERIAAITFTDKAAAEMKARLRATFRARAATDDAEVMTRWRDLERRIESARINTIHGFCAALLRENALRLGIDPEFGLQTDADSALMRRRAVRETLHRLLDAEDEAALRLATDYPMARLEEYLGGLLQSGLRSRQAFAQGPYDNAEALVAHWAAMLPAWRAQAYEFLRTSPKLKQFVEDLSAFDGLCENPQDGREIWRGRMLEGLAILRNGSADEFPDRAIGLLADKPAESAAGKNWESPEDFKALSKVQDKVRDFARDFMTAYTPDPAVEADAAQRSCDFAQVFGAIVETYVAAKATANVLDFDDLLIRTHDALTTDAALAARVASDLDHLLIDEFQDTDDVQLALARAIADAPEGPALFFVGDAKQSIYRFRGADVAVFLGARDAAVARIALDTNFRTTCSVLDFVNAFFEDSQLLSAIVKDDETVRLAPHRSALDGARVELLCPVQPDDAPWNAPDRREAEADLLARHIRSLCDEAAATQVWDDAAQALRPATYGDVAILFRATGEMAIYEQALRAVGIPYVSTAGAGFYKLQEVFDIVNVCKVVLDPLDEPPLLAFLRSLLAALSDESLYRMTRGRPLAVAFQGDATYDLLDAQAARLNAARGLIAALRAIQGAPLAEILHRLVDQSGIEAILLGQHHGVQKASNIRKLLTLAASFSSHRPPSLHAFIEYVDAVRDGRLREGEAALEPEGAGAVTLMTVHKSKGLEFPVVFVADMGRGSMAGNRGSIAIHRQLGFCINFDDGDRKTATKPVLAQAISDRESAEENAESARLLYVALTRARDHLVLCGAPGSDRSSWWESLNSLLATEEQPHGAIIERDGWRVRVVREAPEFSAPREEAPQPTPDTDAIAQRVARYESPEGLESVSVSRLLDALGGEADPHLRREPDDSFSPGARAAMRRGSLVHRMFEYWNFATDALPPWDRVFAGTGIGLTERAGLEAEFTEIARRFQGMPIAETLRAGAMVDREFPFLLDLDGVWLRGTIDLLVKNGPIVDFKTGAYHPERHTRYAWQLQLYAAAAQELSGILPPHGVLVYVDAGREEIVPFVPDEIAAARVRAREIARTMAMPSMA